MDKDKNQIIIDYGVEKIPENRYRGFDPPRPSLSPELKFDLREAIRAYYGTNSPEDVSSIARQLAERENKS